MSDITTLPESAVVSNVAVTGRVPAGGTEMIPLAPDRVRLGLAVVTTAFRGMMPVLTMEMICCGCAPCVTVPKFHAAGEVFKIGVGSAAKVENKRACESMILPCESVKNASNV